MEQNVRKQEGNVLQEPAAAMHLHAVFFISNTVEFRLVLYLKVPRFFTSFVTYLVPYFSFKILDSVGLILVSVLKSGG